MASFVASLLSLSLAMGATDLCNLNGNWTNHKNQHPSSPSDVVHIEFFQELGNATFTLRTTPWGDTQSYGKVLDQTHVRLLMVGGSIETLALSDNCTLLSAGWCKFPHCGFPEPAWKPWSPPKPPRPPAPPRPQIQNGSCAVKKDCPSPTWPGQYRMNLSTVAQPCNASGYFSQGAEFGLVSFDWSNAKNIWASNPNSATNCSEMLVEQARRVKQHSPLTRVFVYHNFELALEWLANQRAAMYDPALKGFFLQYQNGPRRGQIYNEPQLHGLKQYFWDFRNESTVEFWLNEVASPLAVGSPYVDGIFTDDVSGDFEEHARAVTNMGLNAVAVADIISANQRAYDRILQVLLKLDGYDWQAFGAGDGVSANPLPTAQQGCATIMAKLCADASLQTKPFLWSAGRNDKPPSEQMVAAFMIVRGPHAWLGTGWQGCTTTPSTWQQHPLLQLDPGTPVTACAQAKPAVFSRQYSHGTVTLDCNSFKAVLPF